MLKDLVVKEACKKVIESKFAPTDMEAIKKQYGLASIERMTANENPLGMSPKAKEAMLQSLDKANLYGNDVQVLMQKLADQNHFEEYGLDRGNILVTSGATQAINLILEVFLNPGDEVLYCAPTYQNYDAAILRCEGVIKSIPVLPDLHQDLDGLLENITEKTKVVMVCNPNNPTAIAEDYDSIVHFIERFPDDVILLLDEAYIQFADQKTCHSAFDQIEKKHNLVICQTFSKLYGMAGCRVGYLLACHEMIGYFNRYFSFSLPRPNVAAAIGALEDKEFIEATLQNNLEGRNYLCDELTKMGYHPTESSTNFVYCDLGDPVYLADEALKRGVLFRGNLEKTRISIGTMEQNKKCIEVIKEIMEK